MEIVLRQSQFLKTSLKPVFENLPKPHLILSTVLISLYLFHPLNFLENSAKLGFVLRGWFSFLTSSLFLL
jgi:hypothetical protein